MASQRKAVGLKLKNSTAGVLQSCYTGVQGGALLIKLRNAAAQLAQLTDQSTVVLEHMNNRAQVVTAWGVEARVT